MNTTVKIALIQQHATRDLEENFERGISNFEEAAEIVFVPQAGVFGEWKHGMYEKELQVACFQNGYYGALVNRVGKEERNHFSGGSFVVAPSGEILCQASRDEDQILYADCDLREIGNSHAKRNFLPDRRPDYYQRFED